MVEERGGNLIHCPFESRIDPTVSLVNEAALTDLDLLGVAAVYLASDMRNIVENNTAEENAEANCWRELNVETIS